LLLQCKKVQLSGEKCHLLVLFVLVVQEKGIRCFKGLRRLSLDAKGRLSVPTRHRDVLSATAAAS
jgi:ribosomal protein L5